MNIVITGASRGIGFELAKFLSANPKNTIIAIARNAEKLAALKRTCSTLNPLSKVIPIVCDLSKTEDILSLNLKIKAELSSVNILINNVGAIVNKAFSDITYTDMEYVYRVNIFSVFQLIQTILPLIDKNKKSHIVNISSMGGFQGSAKFAGLSAYSSSKAALACLTECLAEEFKDSNISVNCLALGATQTEMLNEAFPNYKAPLSAPEMASFIADFALNGHKFMNGKIIPVSLSTP